MRYFLFFLILSFTIWQAGSRLTQEVDALSEETGIGKGFMGVFLLGLITSLPELFSTITAGFIANPDLGLGNIYGSNVFNLTMLIWADAFYRSRSLSNELAVSSIFSGMGAIFMITLLTIGVFLAKYNLLFSVGRISIIDVLCLLGYFWVARAMWGKERQDMDSGSCIWDRDRLIRIGFLSLVVVIAGILIAFVCDKLSELSIGSRPLGATFVGGLLLGFATSLPELSVSISAARMGSADMSVGNVFGSNMFNVIIIPIGDIFSPHSLWAGSLMHLFSYAMIVLMTSSFLLFFFSGPKKKIGPFGPVSYVLLGLYLVWVSVLYYLR